MDCCVDPVLPIQSDLRPVLQQHIDARRMRTRQVQPQHLMVSYSWRYKKDVVVEFCNRLRSIGYDVWRDEDGSLIQPAMAECSLSSMASAVENSYAVIIFVSRDT